MRPLRLPAALLLLAAAWAASAQTLEEALEARRGGDVERARVALETLAGQNNRDAQFQLGVLYEVDYKRPELAAGWYARAAENGQPQAMNNLGALNYEGRGVPPNRARAYDLYRKAAEAGVPAAQYNVALMLGRGDGVAANAVEASKWLERSAYSGYDRAQAQYGRLLLEGYGTPRNPREAAVWFEKSAAQGYVWGQYFYGYAKLRGEGTQRDLAAAFDLLSKAATQGNAPAMFQLAKMSELGMGQQASDARAIDLYTAAAEQGHADAMRRLVEIYANGELSVRADPARARRLGRPAGGRREEMSGEVLVVQGAGLADAHVAWLAAKVRASRVERLDGEAARFHDAARDADIPAYCAEAGLDFGYVAPGARFADFRLVAMDMDSTLITIECIDEIADLAGLKPQVAAITASAMRGEIDFRESLGTPRRAAAGAGDRGAAAGLRRAPATLSGRGASPRSHARHRREDAARVRRLHVLHRPPQDAARARLHAGEHARREQRPSGRNRARRYRRRAGQGRGSPPRARVARARSRGRCSCWATARTISR